MGGLRRTPEQLRQALKDFYAVRGTFPLCRVNTIHWRDEDKDLCKELNVSNIVTYIKHFGSYRSVLDEIASEIGIKWKQRRAPGFKDLYKYSPNYKRYTKEGLIDILNEFYAIYGEYPTFASGKYAIRGWHKRFGDKKLPRPKTISRHFGNYTNAKQLAKEARNV